MTADGTTAPRRHRAASAATAAAAAVVALVLTGWWLDVPVLYTFGGEGQTAPVSAIGLALVLLGAGRTGRPRTILGSSAMLLGVGSLLAEELLLAVERVPFPSADAVSSPGTAAVVLLLATSLLLRRRLPDTAAGLAVAAGSVSLVAAIGPWVGWDWAAAAGAEAASFGMAWPTTALALLTIVALAWAVPEGRWDVTGLHRGTPVMLAASALTPWLVVAAVGDTGRPGYLAGVLGAALIAVLLSRSLGGTTQRIEAVRSMVEIAPDATLVVGRDGRIISVNDQLVELAGRTREDLETARVDSLVPIRTEGRHAAMRQGFHDAAAARAMGRVGQIDLRRGDDTEVPVEIALAPITVGGTDFTIAMVRDVTAQRAAIEELRRVDRLRRSVLEAVSHELRTPLAVLLGVTSVLRSEHGRMQSAQVDELLDRAGRSARQLDGFVRDLLELQHLSSRADRASSRVTADELGDAARRAIDVVGLDEVTVQVARDAPPVLVIDDLVGRVFVHLLDNAGKYAPGPVEVTIRALDEGLEVRVEDHGEGLPDHLVDSVFQPFDRGVRAGTAEAGTGIGLSLVAGFATQAGGRAWATHRADAGAGASFRLWLPAAPEAATADVGDRPHARPDP